MKQHFQYLAYIQWKGDQHVEDIVYSHGHYGNIHNIKDIE